MADKVSNSFKTLFKLWKLYARMDLLWFLRDTRYCLLQMFADTTAAAAALSGVFLLSLRFGSIGGMTAQEVLFMLGYATITDGIFMMFLGGDNVGYISRVIGRGQLDHKLIQPVPIWMQLATEGFIPFSGSSMLICGIAVIVYAVSSLHLRVTAAWIALMIANLLCSIAVIMSVVYIISCTAFLAPAAAEEISMHVHELFKSVKIYPLVGLPVRQVIVFCTILPVGLAAWLPANALLGKSPCGIPGYLTAIVTAILTLAAIILFKKGMKYYEKYGSNRYTGFGHR